MVAARNGVPCVIMNDAWHPAYWAAVNLEVNQESLFVTSVTVSGEPPGSRRVTSETPCLSVQR